MSLETFQTVFVPFSSLEEATAAVAQEPYALVLRVIVPVLASLSYSSHQRQHVVSIVFSRLQIVLDVFVISALNRAEG